MLNIGIERTYGFIYEGTGSYGHALWPAPMVTPAKLVFPSEGNIEAEKSTSSPTQTCRFREDSFDPVSRIRRGRFYRAEGRQPVTWTVQPHPALPIEHNSGVATERKKSLDTFYGYAVWNQWLKNQREQPIVVLGVDDRYSVWTIVSVEVISTGEDLVTLKAHSSLGVLPTIIQSKLPETYRSIVEERLDAFVDEVHRASPISAIDRARDAAVQILLAYYGETGRNAQDLAKLAERLQQESMVIAASVSRVIARLHARAKPTERTRRQMRPIREKDADLATQCLGTLLCELGWADWA